MTTTTRRAGAAAAAAVAAVFAAGCGSTAAPHAPAASRGVPASSLATSMATTTGSWAVAVMGGSASQHNNFWQLFVRPAASSRWQLVTPPGTADNGGLIVAGGIRSLVTAFRPSQLLTYPPLTATSDGGRSWSALSPLDATLASTPDALAASPTGGTLAALLSDGTAEVAAAGSAAWKPLATPRTVAVTPAGRRCGLQTFTAAAYTTAGLPLLAGACSRPGTAGIFAAASGAWQLTGPVLPPALSGERVSVVRLGRTASQIVALLSAGSGHDMSLLAAWSADNGTRWTLSAALPLDSASIESASIGLAGTVAVVTGGRAEVCNTGGQWRVLPALPPWVATLVPGPGGQTDALAAHGSTLTVWQLAPGASDWAKAQVIDVPIQYGSSG